MANGRPPPIDPHRISKIVALLEQEKDKIEEPIKGKLEIHFAGREISLSFTQFFEKKG